MAGRIRTNYPGVYYRESARIGRSGTEKVYYIVFKKDGKTIEEKVGRQYADDITPARAARIRGDRVEGRRQSRKEIKTAQEAKNHRVTVNKIWEIYKQGNPQLKGLIQDECRYDNYIKPNFGNKEPRDILGQSHLKAFC